MLFYVSDAHHKEKSDATCCCGCPPKFKIYRGQFAEALQIAKRRKNHTVYWKDISNITKQIISHIQLTRAQGFNTGNTINRALYSDQSLEDHVRKIWNNPKNAKSPYKYFGGILYPIGLDEDNNVIYKYNSKKAGE